MNNDNVSRLWQTGKSIDNNPVGDQRHRRIKTAVRYGLWVALAVTANANRRHFGMATTWLPHLVGNSIALFLPELYRLLDSTLSLADRLPAEKYPTLAALRLSMDDVARDNPDYVDYVAPAAIAYIVSHPHFNIYRGSWGEKSFLGFGLDSIPHSSTAYALSNLSFDGLAALERHTRPDAIIQPVVQVTAKRKVLTVGAILAGLTLFYEMSEFLIHRAELKARDNDASQINMVWSVQDTVFDVFSNIIGWAVAAARQR